MSMLKARKPTPTSSLRAEAESLPLSELAEKSEYPVHTRDGWELCVTRYRARPQSFEQPLLNEPLLLVHGFSQNRRAFTAGVLVRGLLARGVDVHLIELRGHGKSSIERQRQRHRSHGTPLPADIDYGWDIDSYLLEDVPAAVAEVKRQTGRDKVFYAGHSLGGILGYGYAGTHDDLAGLITLGSAADLGSDFLLVKLLAWAEPFIAKPIDLTFLMLRAADLFVRLGRPQAEIPRFRYVPMDLLLRLYGRLFAQGPGRKVYEQLTALSEQLVLLSHPQQATPERVSWLLDSGGEREPRPVLTQLTRWIRNREMKCYRSGYDFWQGYERLTLPIAVIFGEIDKLAATKSQRRLLHSNRSEYLLWRPLPGHAHLELTMGHCVGDICNDIEELIIYARNRGAER
jgi:pimeloyl-ACP methyl ester carboxylesterase